MKYCPTSTTRTNPASTQNFLTLLSCESDLIRSSYCCHRIRWCKRFSFCTRTYALISLKTIDCPINTSGFPDRSWYQYIRFSGSILMGFKFLTYVRNCSVKTALIGNNNYAKHSLNCWMICSEVYWQFSMSFAFERTPGQWSRCTENGMSAFCEFPTAFSPRYDPKLLMDYSLPKTTTSFQNLDQWMTVVLYQISLQVLWRLWHLPNIILCCLLCHTRCHWTLTWIQFFLWKFLVFLPSRSVDHWLHRRAAKLWILGRCSTRIQSTLHWYYHNLSSFSRSWPLQFCSSKIRWIPHVDGSFQETKNLRRHRLLCAEDW